MSLINSIQIKYEIACIYVQSSRRITKPMGQTHSPATQTKASDGPSTNHLVFEGYIVTSRAPFDSTSSMRSNSCRMSTGRTGSLGRS